MFSGKKTNSKNLDKLYILELSRISTVVDLRKPKVYVIRISNELKKWIGKSGSEEIFRSLSNGKPKRFGEIASGLSNSTRAQRLKEAQRLRLIEVLPVIEERNFLYRITREGLKLLKSLNGIHELEKVLKNMSEG